MCEYCDGGEPLVIGKTDDQGIAIWYPNILIAYGYDTHGTGSNGLVTRINYCPMCGKKLSKYQDEIDHFLDDLFYDEETSQLTISRTVRVGDNLNV